MLTVGAVDEAWVYVSGVLVAEVRNHSFELDFTFFIIFELIDMLYFGPTKVIISGDCACREWG